MPDPDHPLLDNTLRSSLATLLDIVADGVIVTDTAGVIRYFNHGAVTLFGYPAAEVVGQPIELLLPKRHADVHPTHVAHFAHGAAATRWMNQRSGVTGRRADGSEFPAEITIAKWPGGDGLLLAAVVRDVTERERLHRREQLIASAGERLAETLDVAQTLGAVVEAAMPTLGEWAVVDLVARERSDLPYLRRASHHDDIRLEGALRGLERRPLTPDAPSPVIDVIRTGRPLLVDPVDDDWMERHSRDPEELILLQQLRPHAFLITPLPGRDRVIGALSIGVSSPDRTLPADLGEAAEALASVAGLELTNALLFQTAEQALIGRDRVLEIVAHDLRNLSSAARMCAIALEGDPDAETSVRAELYSTIRESSDAIHRLVGDLLDLAAIDRGRLTVAPAPAAPATVVAAVAGLFRERASSAGITLATDIATGLPELPLDRDRIIQALTNLVHNALKFTPAGGRITLGATATRDSVVIHVSDTGSGMPTRHAHRGVAGRVAGQGGPRWVGPRAPDHARDRGGPRWDDRGHQHPRTGHHVPTGSPPVALLRAAGREVPDSWRVLHRLRRTGRFCIVRWFLPPTHDAGVRDASPRPDDPGSQVRHSR